jgi:hypothetical protein
MIILTSECNDTGTIPNANRLLFSPVRAELQGHKCILEGPNPGMLIADTKDFIPLVTEEETGYALLPMFPPPSYTTRHTGIYSNSMRVINMNSGNNSASGRLLKPGPASSGEVDFSLFRRHPPESSMIRGAQAAEGGLQGAGACSGPRGSPGQHARLWACRCRLLKRRSSIVGGRSIFSNFLASPPRRTR